MVNMRSNRLVIGAIRRLPGIILAMLMAGCGTLATPVMHEATATPITVDKIVPESDADSAADRDATATH